MGTQRARGLLVCPVLSASPPLAASMVRHLATVLCALASSVLARTALPDGRPHANILPLPAMPKVRSALRKAGDVAC